MRSCIRSRASSRPCSASKARNALCWQFVVPCCQQSGNRLFAMLAEEIVDGLNEEPFDSTALLDSERLQLPVRIAAERGSRLLLAYPCRGVKGSGPLLGPGCGRPRELRGRGYLGGFGSPRLGYCGCGYGGRRLGRHGTHALRETRTLTVAHRLASLPICLFASKAAIRQLSCSIRSSAPKPIDITG